MNLVLLLEWTIKSLVILVVFVILGAAYLTFFERRVLARIQTRIGPNRAGPFGVLQPMADVIKLVFKEDLIPAQADKVLFILAPVITVVPAFILLAVIPIGPNIGNISMGLAADINVGVLYIMAAASIAVYGIVIAGWASANKYALMGGIRSTAQMISYELALALSFVGPILLTNSENPMSVSEIVIAQRSLWFIFLQPVGFLIYLMAAIAEVNRAPFDLPEAEQELTAGYHTEYSGLKFALFYLAEYGKMIVISFIGATLFLGGYWGPFVEQVPLLGPLYLIAKVVALLFVIVWLRATFPRLRYDNLMAFGWKFMLPVALLNVMVTALIVVLVGG
ncbi:MAG: NADH-quinone oxidoreductase subunit NuoH [Anaerolineales bacterium]|nr:NADH-quinone oxidoreductase subunit NuoH [Anaerolineales bacterium]